MDNKPERPAQGNDAAPKGSLLLTILAAAAVFLAVLAVGSLGSGTSRYPLQLPDDELGLSDDVLLFLSSAAAAPLAALTVRSMAPGRHWG